MGVAANTRIFNGARVIGTVIPKCAQLGGDLAVEALVVHHLLKKHLSQIGRDR